MNLRLARGTPWWIGLSWIPTLLVRGTPARLACAGLAAGATAFFRDPSRRARTAGLVAPADGRIREVTRRPDGRWFVSIYLALYNVHVTRMPCDGVVTRQDHVEGEHRLAFADTASTNERMEWVVNTEWGPLEMTQYSGAAARRIVPYVGVGARSRRGERIGLIRFGSRVDLLLPLGLLPTVVVGQRPRAGEDIVAITDGSLS
ncbi:MAG: phosphatidylserine decarboxylase [Nocardioides sp.]|nr:phosphatidylserine decarboxylase [Nocardioides sp.]